MKILSLLTHAIPNLYDFLSFFLWNTLEVLRIVLDAVLHFQKDANTPQLFQNVVNAPYALYSKSYVI